MTIYVCGFLFSPDYKTVVLIRKRRPDWQNGFLNGVGGKVEPPVYYTQFGIAYAKAELPMEAMIREFKEETGVSITDWDEFLVLSGPDYQVFFYKAVSDKWHECNQTTDEAIEFIQMYNLPYEKLLSNLRWLLPMCLDDNHLNGNVTTKG